MNPHNPLGKRLLAALALGVGLGGAPACGRARAAVEELESAFASDSEDEQALPDDAQRVLERLASDPDRRLRGAFLERVGSLLGHLSMIDRTRLVAEWSTSERPELRVAIARSLRFPYEALGVPAAIDLLRTDADESVRQEAAAAARARDHRYS